MTPTSGYVGAWSFAFVVTCVIELAIVLPLLRTSGTSLRRLASICVIANLTTHPLVWFVFPFLGLPPLLALALSELWAFGIEVWVYHVTLTTPSVGRCAATSLAANTASALGYAALTHALS
jgi:hypothetical protein